ncbi:MAG TPA: hypothetical protein VL334_09240, partial [Anaerolineae bacterium]|nr:hypothetical protein [Anaerolineae bacterium]
GGATAYSADIPLLLAAGAPQRYELATVDTSGWNAGLYTATVELLDASETLIPDGSGYAFLAVGQALGASHAVAPAVLPPGNVTVTTVITTEILVDTILPESAAEAQPLWEPQGLRAAEAWNVTKEAGGEVVSAADQSGMSITLTPAFTPTFEVDAGLTLTPTLSQGEREPERELEGETEVVEEIVPDNGRAPDAAVARAEQTDGGFTYGGTWQAITNSRASGNSYTRSRTAGHTVSYGFAGDWVTLGLFGASSHGQAELFIDGVSQGVIDLYRREDTAYSLTFDGLGGGAHTIALTVLGTHNPKSTDNWVGIDYVDTWDGAALPDGTFEQTDPRVFLSGGWSNVNDVNASGGSYVRGTASSAWFPFSGDSFSFHAVTRAAARTARLYVDGAFLTEIDLFDWGNITRTLSFQGFGPGPHVLQVSSQNGEATVDAFTQPGSAPWTDPSPPPASFQRYEADNTAWLYNGEPFIVTARTWTREVNATSLNASRVETVWSNTASDSAALTFDGSWAALGFTGDSNGGSAEVFLDGVSQGIVNTYRREVEPVSFTLGSLTPGNHTVSLVVQGGSRVRLDYLDVWDGAALPDGAFGANDFDRFCLDNNWGLRTSISPPGQYLRSANGNAWFPFTGNTVSFEGWNDGTVRQVKLYVDDSYKGDFDLEASGVPTPTWSFDGLGAGAHVLRVQGYQSNATIGAFIQPGAAPFYAPPAIGAFQRYEEDWPAVLYNGLPYTTTVASWTRLDNSTVGGASRGQVIWSGTANDTITFTFSGVAVGVGLLADRFGGRAEVFLDGVSQGVIDTYRADNDFLSVYYDGLAGGPHTLTATVLGTSHPNASGTRVYLDYIDVWNGTPLGNGTFEQDDSRVLRSLGWDLGVTDANASGGSYARDGLVSYASMWFPFSGDSVTYQAMARSDGDQFAIAKIDGQFVGYLNLYSSTITPRTFSFDGLGAGLHVLHIQRHRGELTVDAFRTPGAAPFYSQPSYSGIVRYEENDPALRYSGWPYSQRPQTWFENNIGQASGNFVVGSATANNTASLQFNGAWVSIGFRTRSNAGQAEILIDGVSQGVVGLYSANDDVTSRQFGGLSAGPHTVEVRVVGAPDPPSTQNNVWIDYIDVYDGLVVSDSFSNANLAHSSSNNRVHFSSFLGTFPAANGIEGDYTGIGVGAPDANVWYSFVGDSATFYGFTRSNNPTVDVFIDDVLVATETMDYDFTDSPLAFHYTGLSDGPHVMRINNTSGMRVDGFAANPSALVPYLPMVEWYDDAPAGNGAPFFGSLGMVSGMAAGDINNDGIVELVFGADTLTIWGKLFVYRADGGDTGDGDPILWTDDIGGAPINRALIGSIALANL